MKRIKIIADSGSTTTDWLIIDGSRVISRFSTTGMNPLYRSAGEISAELRVSLPDMAGLQAEEIFFYGAGVVDEQRGDIIRSALGSIFPDVPVAAHSDVVGAARALFGGGAGVCCILGTGSNACLYDGERITYGVPPLGFILGDECSGAVLGRKLIGDYFKGVMPEDVRTLFREEYAPDISTVISNVYGKDMPNRYLASFAPFLGKHRELGYCSGMLVDNLREFFNRNVLQIPGVAAYKTGFAGSLAFHFSEMVVSVAQSFGFTVSRIIKNPIDELAGYHGNG